MRVVDRNCSNFFVEKVESAVQLLASSSDHFSGKTRLGKGEAGRALCVSAASCRHHHSSITTHQSTPIATDPTPGPLITAEVEKQ